MKNIFVHRRFNSLCFVDDYGHDGPIGVSQDETQLDITDYFMNASIELGVKRNPTYNNGHNQGK